MIEEFEIASGHAKELNNQIRDYKNELVGANNAPPALSTVIDHSIQRLAATAQSIAQDRREPHVTLQDGESTRIYYTQVLLALAGLCVLWVFLHIQTAFLPRLGALAFSVIVVIAIVEAGVVLGASYMLSHGVRIVIEEAEAKVVATPRDWVFGGAAVAAIVAVVGFNLFLILREGAASEWLWVALAIACVAFMVYVGRNLSLMAAAVWNALKGIAFAMAATSACVLAALFGTCGAALLAVNGLLAILSYPFQILMRIFRRPAPAVSAAR
jgi:hypothetical protein